MHASARGRFDERPVPLRDIDMRSSGCRHEETKDMAHVRLTVVQGFVGGLAVDDTHHEHTQQGEEHRHDKEFTPVETYRG